MTLAEALAILDVTHKLPVWLLAQVHPDRHPEHSQEAQKAFQRVALARVVRGGRVSEVGGAV